MSIIWTPLSSPDDTMAYVRAPTSNASTSYGTAKASKPPSPSNTAETGEGDPGSVMSIIWTPLSRSAVTIA